MNTTIYVIARAKHWKNAYNQGNFTHATIHKSLAEQGFINASDEPQALAIVNERYQAEDDLVLLSVDPDKLVSPLKYEVANDGQTYPRIYGPLNLKAVTTVRRLAKNDDGSFHL